ncbi:hypothetical protein RHOFW510R12_02745 [Rhodanobacter sp. FW510-R12]|uniref:hypothetical protein n=1 Tax=unclassified Rhodanobacter TaxID=2621553 RepID=UPI0007AA0E78|nr:MULTISPECIES: hypothetical protein [unclassified Rhodanobacter]KZC17796.1 hypothetical protein RHOFW104R8_09225 [Rhodanobacter sp. FW104-R8]KZC27200.1 hypothetical protein RhoFW510T8_15945 [Rhodanobacter sp. FW510-T8]KZC31638.1 hypothetical protein RhoFW510R10_15890 [Rhodanobacter sp. FW510-R10]
MKLTAVSPFIAGYGRDDENLGKAARPDKVKLALDKARYHARRHHEGRRDAAARWPRRVAGEIGSSCSTRRTIEAKAGATFEIPVTKERERHDVCVIAPVFRGGEAADHPLRVTLKALGVQGEVQWLLDGRLQGSSDGAAARSLTLPQPGPHTITALARSGAFSALQVRVAD